MSKTIKKTIVVSQVLNGGTGQFTEYINIDFIPDEVIVKNITYAGAINTEAGVEYITSDLVNNETIGCIYDGCNADMSLAHNINKPIKGTYTFTVKDMAGALQAGRTGDLAIILQFVKYL